LCGLKSGGLFLRVPLGSRQEALYSGFFRVKRGTVPAFHTVYQVVIKLSGQTARPDLGSSRQCCNPTGGSPVMPIARFRHVVMPQFMGATSYSLRGVKDPAALNSVQRWEQSGGLASMGA